MLKSTKLWISFGIALVVVGVVLGVTLPLTVFDKREIFIGSDVLNEVPLIDGHSDLPSQLYEYEKEQLDYFDFDSNLLQNPRWNLIGSWTDLPRLRKGKVGGQFWVAFSNCQNNNKDAVERTLEQIDLIKRLVNKYPNDLMYVTEADQIMEAFNQKKIASMIQVESGQAIDSRLSVLRLYYELGVRCMVLTHSCDLPWADSSFIDVNPTAVKKNITGWGLKVIAEMNRLGMIIDLSHVSEGVMMSALENSKAQVIFSHSSVYTLQNHHRNVKDSVLQKVKEKNGLVMIAFNPGFIGGNNTIDDLLNHINYVRSFIGADHVGIGGSMRSDGIEKVFEGFEDNSKYPDIFDRLAEGGNGIEPWSRNELQKLAGLNLIRVFKDVERISVSLQNEKMITDSIPYDDIIKQNPEVENCRTDIESYNPMGKFLRALNATNVKEL